MILDPIEHRVHIGIWNGWSLSLPTRVTLVTNSLQGLTHGL
jgi:hypothetical protein